MLVLPALPAAQSANSAPTFSGPTDTRSVKENRCAGTAVGSPVIANDAVGDVSTTIVKSEGKVSGFSDATSKTLVKTEEDPSPPLFDEGYDISRDVDENVPVGTNIGAPVVAQDPEQAGPVSYSLRGDLSQRLFAIDSASGQLSTAGEIDYETAWAGSDFQYRWIDVEATDNDGQSRVTRVILQVNDQSGELTGPANLVVTPVLGGLDVSWDVVPGAIEYRVDWRAQLYGPPKHLTWKAWELKNTWAFVTGTSYQIRGLVSGVPYQVRVSAKNAEGYGEPVFDYNAWRNQIPLGDPPRCGPGNSTPYFVESPTTIRGVVEGTAANTPIGSPVRAYDCDESDTRLIYAFNTSSGDHADFTLDTATGQLKTRSALSYGTKSSYQVIIQVQDGKDRWGDADSGFDDSITVTIQVEEENRNELPPPDHFTYSPVENGLLLSWRHPKMPMGSSYSYHADSYRVEYRLRPDSDYGLDPVSWGTPVYRDVAPGEVPVTITGLQNHKVYALRVQAVNSDGYGLWTEYIKAVPLDPSTEVSDKHALEIAGVVPDVVDAQAPPAPTHVRYEPLEIGLVIHWRQPDLTGKPAVTDYQVEYRWNYGGEPTYMQSWSPPSYQDVPASDRSLRLTTRLRHLGWYALRVRARNSAGYGAWSEFVDVRYSPVPKGTTPAPATVATVPVSASAAGGAPRQPAVWQPARRAAVRWVGAD